MATYKHHPLHGPRNTRLIRLEPSKNFSSPLQCRLFEISIDENHQYEALSYSWGPPVMDRTVLCFNIPLGITANCEAAMRYLRLPDQPRVLWIDSICIDQESNPEKNQQIPLMKDIYGKAGEVLVWLGEETKACKYAITLLTGHSQQQLIPSIEHSRDGNVDLQTTGLKLFANAISWCILMVIVKPALLFCSRIRGCPRLQLISFHKSHASQLPRKSALQSIKKNAPHHSSASSPDPSLKGCGVSRR
jgi:hypothetical protein